MKFLSTTMVNNSRGKDARAKQEGEISDIKSSSTTTTSGSRQWAGFKNPRIVRVSRSFGGKDRHSKVCTIRGLKDRRIRLSVPSAIQLYDLQDRLGLNQPSKVVDWLLDNTKDDIDKLPPLQMPSGDFTQFYHHHHHQQTLAPHHELYTPQSNSLSPFFDINSQFMKDGRIQFFGKEEGLYKINNDNPDEDSHMMASRKSKLYLATTSLDAATDHSREKHKEVDRENLVDDKWNVPDNYEGCSDHRVISCNIPQLSAQNFLPLINQLSFPSIISNTAALPYTREPPSLSLSQFGISQVLFPSQVIQSQSDTHSAAANSVLHPLAQSTPSQFLLYPPAVTTPLFPPQYHSHLSTTTNNSSIENDPRPANHFPFMSSSGSQNLIIPNSDIVSPFHFINPFSCVNTKENLQKNEDTTK